MKNFVNNLAAAWYAPEKAQAADVEAFVLVCYLRLYHPEVHRLLTYDPDQVGTLHDVLMQDDKPPAPQQAPAPVLDPVRLLFIRAFRHTRPVWGELKRADEDVIVNELVERLDRHKGDTAFRKAWAARYADKVGADVSAILEPILVVGGEP